jgi:protein-disulfide isomerase
LLLTRPSFVVAQVGIEKKIVAAELREMREELKALRKDIEDIKNLLRQSPRQSITPTSQDVVLHVENTRIKGDRTARITIVEFSDFECPFCRQFARETLPQIERDYVRTGKLRYAFRNYPLTALHKDAFKAAEAAGCAQEQGKFWEMHQRLFAHEKALGESELHTHAEAVGLDLQTFQACLRSEKQALEIHNDAAEAMRARVRGTPTFFLGFTDPDSSDVKPVEVIIGAQPYFAFKMAIEKLLATKQ